MQKAEQEKEDEKIYHNLYMPSNKVHCGNCEKDITKHARVQCVECPGLLEICMNCFLNLCEFNNHTPKHSYRLINKLNFPLFVEDYTAEEELLLLEGLEKKGFGNWADIAEAIGSDKSKEELEKHYDEIYLSNQFKNKNTPMLSGRDPETLALTQPKLSQIRKKLQKKEEKNQKETIPKVSGNRVVNAQIHTQTASDIIGYMPKRGDFDVEYDNDAELLLAEMEFNDDDKEYEIEMKYKVLDIYNLRLDERNKRKQFVIERDLLNLKKQNILEKQRTKDEKEFYNLMKAFARFNDQETHERLVQGLIREKQIRARIEELRYYRKLGMKTFAEVENYLAEKRKKDEAYQRRQKQNDSFVYDNQKSQQNRLGQRRQRTLIDQNDLEVIEKRPKTAPNMSEQEISLTERLGITPQEYLILKEVMVRESVRQGFLKKDQYIQTLKLDKERVSSVYDFLVQNQKIMDRNDK